MGGGVGGIASIFEGDDFRGLTGRDSQSDFTFAYQGVAGLAFAVADRADIGVVYKFLGTADHTFQDLKTRENYSHSIMATFDFRF